MMEAVRGWLLAVISVSLMCALADALMPQGPVRRVGRLVCGLVLLAAILSPVKSLDIAQSQRWLDQYLTSLDLREAELNQELGKQMKVIIEEEYAAYIVDKAAQMGLTCTARVECREEEGLYLPARTEVTGPLSEADRNRLAQVIGADLGVPAEGQSYVEKEEVP